MFDPKILDQFINGEIDEKIEAIGRIPKELLDKILDNEETDLGITVETNRHPCELKRIKKGAGDATCCKLFGSSQCLSEKETTEIPKWYCSSLDCRIGN